MTETLCQTMKDINVYVEVKYMNLYLSVEDRVEHAEYNILARTFDI
jgi:hypothetical protein